MRHDHNYLDTEVEEKMLRRHENIHGSPQVNHQNLGNFNAYSTIFKPQEEEEQDMAAAKVFQDDITMPSAFNMSQNQYEVAVESGDQFQQQMAYLSGSMDQIMHENFQLEQQVNKKYLGIQSTAPGSAAEVLHNSRAAMNQFLAAKRQKEELA